MANITTRDTLITAVRSYQEWGSDLTDDFIKQGIALCEDAINGDLMEPEQAGQAGGVNQMLTTQVGTLSTTSNLLALPTGALGVNAFKFRDASGDWATPSYFSPQQLYLTYGGAASDVPAGYTVVGANIELAPTPDAAYSYSLIYYQSIPPLTDSVASNWVITSFPNAYLFGTLAQVSILLMDDDRAAKVFVPFYNKAIDRIRKTSRRLQLPSGSLQIMLSVPTP